VNEKNVHGEEGKAHSPKGKKHRSPKLFRRNNTQRVGELYPTERLDEEIPHRTEEINQEIPHPTEELDEETSHPPKELCQIVPFPKEQLDSEIVEMIDILDTLTIEGCKYTPQLLDHLSAKTPREKVLDHNAFLGGYQELVVTSLVPGRPLTVEYLHGLSAEDHGIICQHLKETILYATKV
jgi:hypothetical protein